MIVWIDAQLPTLDCRYVGWVEIVGWVEPRNPTNAIIYCADVGFHVRSTQPTDL
jgi:hypothetical protein